MEEIRNWSAECADGGLLHVAALAQSNPRGTSTETIKAKTVSVEYGRPWLKGQTSDALLGRLKPGGVAARGPREQP